MVTNSSKRIFKLTKKLFLGLRTKRHFWIISEFQQTAISFYSRLKQSIQSILRILSFGNSNAPDEGGELADFITSDRFQKEIKTKDKDVAAALVTDLAKAAKTRGRFLLS